ncbi:MAG: asparagine synthase (glutamine-hydrolyzing) [Bacteroidetes bacterium]|nr:asparagine synthase (glutamine-hydrolyzing) [Bacteroidota bacterium]
MCGILGQVSLHEPVNEAALQTGLSAIKHRGPDASGSWSDETGKLWLGHRRLSIIDLSDTGAQPMDSPDGRLVVVFNGEIYNFIELKQELFQKGYSFNGHSDTEVLIHAWHQWGSDCLQRLKGMFAFALFDQQKQKLYCARDRAGEKPLYFTTQNGGFAFASELKALLSVFPSAPKVNPTALHALLGWGYVPGKQCILEGYEKLEPGCYLEYDIAHHTLVKHRYWSLPVLEATKPDLIQLETELDQLLEHSVRNQLVADVPVGILLSGGLDSSLITAYAAAHLSKLKTYTVSFPGYGSGDEAPYARLIANYFGTEHTEIQTSQPEPELLFKMAHQFDEPMTDPSLVPTYLLSKAIREHCTVALGGDGGDELFGGYDRYQQWLSMEHQWQSIPLIFRKLLSNAAQSFLPIGFRGRYYLQQIGTDFNRTIPQVDPLFEPAERKGLLGQSFPLIHNKNWRDTLLQNGSDLADRAMRTDFSSYMPDDILVKVDRASMLASLEVRAPLLDASIIDFAFRKIPTSLKVTRYDKKILLKRVATKRLPPSFNFKRKQGFVPPMEIWMRDKKWADFIKDHLLGNSDSWFDKEYISTLWKGQQQGRFNKKRLFTLLMIELWRKEYKVSM